MSCRVWNTRLEDALLMNCEHHSEFVCGVDFNLFRPGQLATASWVSGVCFSCFNSLFDPSPLPTHYTNSVGTEVRFACLLLLTLENFAGNSDTPLPTFGDIRTRQLNIRCLLQDEFVCVFDMSSGPPPKIPPVPKVGPPPPPPASGPLVPPGAMPVR
jgi:hypothetical protein